MIVIHKKIMAGMILALATACIFAKPKKNRSSEPEAPSASSIHADEKTRIPAWTEDAGRLKLFPQSEYISALGIGFSADSAKSRAANGISSFIKTEISSLTKSRYSESEENGIVKEMKSIDEEITLQTDAKLYAMEFTEPWKDVETSQYYCVAFIEKKQAWEQTYPKLDRIAAEIEKKIESAESDTTGFWRTLIFGEILEGRSEFYALHDFVALVNPVGVKKYLPVESKFLEIAKTVQNEKPRQTVWLTVNNDKNGIVYMALAETLEKSGFTVSGSRGKFIATADVSISIRKENDAFVCFPGITLEVKSALGIQMASFSETAKKTVGFEREALEEKAYKTLKKSIENILKGDRK